MRRAGGVAGSVPWPCLSPCLQCWGGLTPSVSPFTHCPGSGLILGWFLLGVWVWLWWRGWMVGQNLRGAVGARGVPLVSPRGSPGVGELPPSLPPLLWGCAGFFLCPASSCSSVTFPPVRECFVPSGRDDTVNCEAAGADLAARPHPGAAQSPACTSPASAGLSGAMLDPFLSPTTPPQPFAARIQELGEGREPLCAQGQGGCQGPRGARRLRVAEPAPGAG